MSLQGSEAHPLLTCIFPLTHSHIINISALKTVLRAWTWEHTPLPPLAMHRERKARERTSLMKFTQLPADWWRVQVCSLQSLTLSVEAFQDCCFGPEFWAWTLPAPVLPSVQPPVPVCPLGIPETSGLWAFLCVSPAAAVLFQLSLTGEREFPLVALTQYSLFHLEKKNFFFPPKQSK